MRISIISLPNSYDRRDSIHKLFSAINMYEHKDYEFFDAIYGKDIKNVAPLSKSIIHYLSMRHNLNPGQLGCLASHIALWRKIVRTKENALILEDDAKPLQSFLSIYPKLDNLTTKYGFIRLESSAYNSLEVEHQGPLKIKKLFCNGMYSSTLAYAISPKTAILILKHTKTWYTPVDHYLGFYFIHHVSLFEITPRLFEVAPSLPSNIKIERSPLWRKPTRRIYKLYVYIRLRYYHYLYKRNFMKSKRI